MCQPNTEITSKVEALLELRRMMEDLNAEAEALTDEIKAFMAEEETMLVGSHKVTYKEVASKRVDTAALRKVLGDALDEYTKIIISRRFSII